MFYNNLGDLLRSIGEFDKALKNYQKSFRAQHEHPKLQKFNNAESD